MKTICTTDIVPVDLNCWLLHTERLLARCKHSIALSLLTFDSTRSGYSSTRSSRRRQTVTTRWLWRAVRRFSACSSTRSAASSSITTGNYARTPIFGAPVTLSDQVKLLICQCRSLAGMLPLFVKASISAEQCASIGEHIAQK